MILDKIVAEISIDLAEKKRLVPLTELVKREMVQPAPFDFAAALRRNHVCLIAEIKKASPSKGIICQNFDPTSMARAYADNGAAAISVLTESKYFQGSLEYLLDIKKTLANSSLPLLRKDFIIDSYQVYEARAYGADCVLLIVAILSPEQLSELLQLSHQLGMTCLVEIHNETELETAITSGASIIGINNRDLNTFKVDLKTTAKLRPLIPHDRIVVSESGIKTRKDMQKLSKWGVNAALVGEALMTAPDIAAKMKELL